MLVVILMAIALVPMLNAFRRPMVAAQSQKELIVSGLRAAGTLARISALEFAALDANRGDPVDLAALFGWPGSPDADEAQKEVFLLDGSNTTPRVVIVDASGGAGGLLELGVTVRDVTLRTLKADY
jgi:hypothetical protein